MRKIGIVGVGVLGTQVRHWFRDAVCYDPAQNLNTWEETMKAGIIFICVPTPYKDGDEYDLSILEESVSKIPDGKTIIIKSTVNPGTTDRLQRAYPKKTIMFNPEFLTENTAQQDFEYPHMQIIGARTKDWVAAANLLRLLPPADVSRIVTPTEAEWIKKLRNAFYAVKVVFFNQMFDIINTGEDVSYDTIRSIVVTDKMIGDSHSEIFHKGYRGYGGKCLPKDLNALINYAKKHGVNPKLFETVREINDSLQKLNEGPTA